MTVLHAFINMSSKGLLFKRCMLHVLMSSVGLSLPGDSVQQTGVFTLLHCDEHLRLDGKHGEDHEGPGTQGQLHHGLHDG